MPLKPFFSIPKTLREWSEWCRNTDVTPSDGTITESMLADNAVSNRALRNSAAFSIIGNPTGSAADPSDIASGSNDTFLARRSGALQFVSLLDGDIPATIARDSEVTTAISNHEAAADPHPGYTTAAELSSAISTHEAAADPHTGYAREASTTTISGAWNFTLPPVLPTYTVATLPSAATYARGLIYVSDETGGAVPAFSDGTNWRRVTDRNIVS